MVFDLPSLLQAYISCRKGKRYSQYSLFFETNLEEYLYNLSRNLITHRYRIGRSTCFVITYPTIREIFAANFIDRIVHHLFINHIGDSLDKTFIYDSLACRNNKGTIFGMKRTKNFLSKVTHDYTKQAYYLKLDIRSFFYSIDKEILLNILIKKISKERRSNLCLSLKEREDLIWLAKKIIFHDPCTDFIKKGSLDLLRNLPKDKSLFTTPKHKGLPIGNLTSQFFANLYLNELDQYIKRILRVKYYLRYADDMLFLSNDLSQLHDIEQKVTVFLLNKLKLEIKESKTRYGSVYQGIDFVGYIIKPKYTLSRNRVVNNIKRKIHYFNNGFLLDRKLCIEEVIPLSSPVTESEIKAICTSINSAWGHLKWSNSYNLKQTLYEKHFGILNEYLEPQGNLQSFRPSKPTI